MTAEARLSRTKELQAAHALLSPRLIVRGPPPRPSGQGQWYQEVSGVPLQAEVLTVPTLGLPLLLVLRILVPGASGNLSLSGREESGRSRARDTCSAADGMQTVGSHTSQAFQ